MFPCLSIFMQTGVLLVRRWHQYSQQVKKQLGENVKIVKVDVDKNPGLAQKYQG